MNLKTGDVLNSLYERDEEAIENNRRDDRMHKILGHGDEEAMHRDKDSMHRIPIVSSVESLHLHGSQEWYMRVCHACMDVGEKEDRVTYRSKAMWTAAEVVVAVNYMYLFQYYIHDVFCNFIFGCGW